MEQLGLRYQQARDLIHAYVTDSMTLIHSRESEIIIHAVAKRLGEEAWRDRHVTERETAAA